MFFPWKKLEEGSNKEMSYAKMSSSKVRDYIRNTLKLTLRNKREVPPPAKSPPREENLPLIIKVYILSADCGIAWNPYMKMYPKEKGEWVFATSATPRFIASKLCSVEERSVCIIHSTSHLSREAMLEIGSVLDVAGADAKTLTLIVGGTIIDACINTVSNINKLFTFIGNLKRPVKLDFYLNPQMNINNDSYLAVEKFIKIPFCRTEVPIRNLSKDTISLKQHICDNLYTKIIPFTPQANTIENVQWFDFDFHINSFNYEKQNALNVLINTGSNMIILVGAVGNDLRKWSSMLLEFFESKNVNRVTIITESDILKLRAGVETVRNDISRRLNDEVLIMQYPHARRIERNMYSGVENARPIIGWITKPSYWYNAFQSSTPEPIIDFNILGHQFEQPNDSDIFPIIRIA